jgi:hypothetical protein
MNPISILIIFPAKEGKPVMVPHVDKFKAGLS